MLSIWKWFPLSYILFLVSPHADADGSTLMHQEYEMAKCVNIEEIEESQNKSVDLRLPHLQNSKDPS
ncbi:hypothetical protein FOXB_01462 [Fusarium oxysporum f. sp. conglutinans Fo5176]|uniref:Uncharacterized protein n=1 Tax=Fusarium oxysporum (strain Fo5176) TaxID=660025 RepID=F9F4Y7_FUSOF|nr:hypothetical protein FOXB_01462 [Fusarium oxysporum f. sp. conglutinans Fo5176]